MNALSTSEFLELYRRMVLVRRFEEAVADLYRDGEVPGFVHLSLGQEASSVGACWPLRREDVITSTHRGHGHCLAKGLEPAAMMAELMGKEAGSNRGRGGSMHIADPRQGIFGANGIVAAGLPIAVGAAVGARVARSDRVTVAFFGDGATGQGAFHEALNLAALWKLPIVFFCENNGWAEFSSSEELNPVSLQVRSSGYGLECLKIDGDDVVEVATTMSSVVMEIRAGDGPVVVEAVSTRWRGHYEGDQQRYRDVDEVPSAQANRDGIALARRRLEAAGISSDELRKLEKGVESTIEDAVQYARAAPPPDVATVGDFVTAPRVKRSTHDEPAGEELGEWRIMDALRAALVSELELDDTVFLAGVDVSQAPFAVTKGLVQRFGNERVRDTPISESAIVGLAVGASMAGMRPIVEIMYLDFIGVCFDQLLNQAAKLRFMTGGRATLPMVVRTQFGAGRSSGSQHSQSLEALLAHIPGLTVAMPSTPADAYGLLRAAIRDPNPVVFIEHRLMYGVKGPQPPPEHLVPLGAAAVVRAGKHVTVVAASRMVMEALAAASDLAAEGIEAEVIDLRTIVPLDWQTVEASVARTGRLVVAHEAVTPFGVGAELAARAASACFWHLDAPVARVGALATPAPYAPSLEEAWLPNREKIASAIRETTMI